MTHRRFDVTIVGAGPNGLTAAAVLSLSGLAVLVLERNQSIGGGCRTEALTLPGFSHDVCAAIHPMGVVSPIFRALRLGEHGVEWRSAPLPLAHPLDDGRVAILSRRLADTEATLGRDGPAWSRLMRPFLERHREFFTDILRPVRIPQNPLLMARFGCVALQSCMSVLKRFEDTPARALFAGNAAHSFLSLTAAGSASFGMVLALAGHAIDWPCARGGSQTIVETLAQRARQAGCEIRTGIEIRHISEVPSSRVTMFDVTPRQLQTIAGEALSRSYRSQLSRFSYGPGTFKLDYALTDKIPWRSPECSMAATVHVGGTAEEIARSEAEATSGRVPEEPFVLVAQQTHIDETRAPIGAHTGWAYCHVPAGCEVDMTERIERQIERFAPGFRDTIMARHLMKPLQFEAHNPNMIGGDIGGGANTLRQFLFRPTLRWVMWTRIQPRST